MFSLGRQIYREANGSNALLQLGLEIEGTRLHASRNNPPTQPPHHIPKSRSLLNNSANVLIQGIIQNSI